MREFCFHYSDNNAVANVTEGLKYFLGVKKPVIICVGTDITIGDSLGPMIGTMLSEVKLDAFVYGKLNETVTAKDILNVKNFILKTHPRSEVLVIDAAIGNKSDVGFIKLSSSPIKPGLGVNKNLPELGSINILGIVSERSSANYSFLNLTRLSPVYSMAQTIAVGIKDYFNSISAGNIDIAL